MGILHKIRVRVLPELWWGGLHIEPWCTPTLTSNSSLKELFTCVLLLIPTYMACTTLTYHSSTPTTWRAHHSTFKALYQRPFPNQQMPYTVSCFARYFSWSCLRIKITAIVPQLGQKSNCISSLLTVSGMMFSTTLSMTFRTWSIVLDSASPQ